MSQERAPDLATLSLVIKLDDTPKQAMKSPSQKRRIQSSPVSSATSSKQRRICNQENYNSPLIHLGKSNVSNTCSSSLDDSVIVLEELETSPASSNRWLCGGKRKRATSPDDSVIILSDNEGESMTVTNVKTKTTPQKLKSKFRQVSTSKLSSNINTTESQPISIDSEDENTIPIDRGSSLKIPYVEITLVDKSPGIGTNGALPSSTISKPGIDKIANSDESDSPLTESDGSSWAVRYALFRSLQLEKAQFLIDKEGDSSNLQCVEAKRKKRRPRRERQQDLRNPNWTKFVTNMLNEKVESSKRSLVQNLQLEPAKITKNYYTTEALYKEPGALREIVIDGCNVAMAYTNGRCFSEEGLDLVIKYFQLRGHTVRVFVPQHQRTGRQFLEHLYTKGIVAFTPSRNIGGRKIISYDDRFILDYAMLCDGIVVSRDQYRDLYGENSKWRNIIENRLLVPTFVGNCVMFPDDPLGRNGPTLENFLRH